MSLNRSLQFYSENPLSWVLVTNALVRVTLCRRNKSILEPQWLNITKVCFFLKFLILILYWISSVQLLSRVRLCDTMNHSTPGLPVHHQLPESTQTHVHRVSDAIQPSHPLSFPSPPAFNLSQHQGIFQWVSFPHQVAKVLEFQLQHQSWYH